MGNAISANQKLSVHLDKTAQHYLANVVYFDIARLSTITALDRATIVATPKAQPRSPDLLKNAEQFVTQTNSEDLDKLLNDFKGKKPWYRRFQRLAVLCLQLGMVALCVVAIRIVLAF